MKTILVAGSAHSLNEHAELATRQVGSSLARNGFGLITGCWRGVDKATGEAFLRSLEDTESDPIGRYTQVYLAKSSAFDVAPALRVEVSNDEATYHESVRRCDSAILIGGLGGTKKVAFELIGTDRPVFPLPLTGGDATQVYGEILERWDNYPVPGLTRNQFMQLSLPLDAGAARLVRLLNAALSTDRSVFVSYRRSDIPGAAGRLSHELGEHLGPRRVFLDTHSIGPGTIFDGEIRDALEESRVFICLIGPRWDVERTHDEDDYVRREMLLALEQGQSVIPVVAFGGTLPRIDDLPSGLQSLLGRQAVFIPDNASWDQGMTHLLRQIDRLA